VSSPSVRQARQDDQTLPAADLSAVEHGLPGARSEATNTHLRLLTRRAYGYHSPEPLIRHVGARRPASSSSISLLLAP